MDYAALGVAAYAAFVGTASLGWQIYSSVRSHRPGIEVNVVHQLFWDDTMNRTFDVIRVTAINHGEHPVSVVGVGLQPHESLPILLRGLTPVGLENTIPGTVEPLHAIEYYFDCEGAMRGGIRSGEPFIAIVGLGNGDQVQSKPATVYATHGLSGS